MTRPRSLPEVLRRAMNSRMLDVFTGLPARVTAYYPGDVPTVDVAPVVKRPLPTADGDTVHEALPIVPNVPVLFPRGKKGTIAITWTIEPGDHVWLQISILSFAEWRRTGKISEAGDLRTHSLGNAYAIPGAAPDTEALPQSSILGLVLEAPAIFLGKDASEFLAIASKVMANLNALKSAIVGADAAAIVTSVGTVVFEDVATEIVKGK